MRAVILAAGQGTRLAPYTDDRPKCLVPLAGRSLLAWQLDALAQAGITDVTVVTGYRADQIEALGVPTVHNARFADTNMVASLLCARALLDGSDDLLVAYGDLVYEPRVVTVFAGARDQPQPPVAITVDTAWRRLWDARMADPLADAETLRLDEAGDVVELGRRPQGYEDVEAQYMGLIRVDRSFAPRLVAIHDALDPAGPYEGRDRDHMFMTSFLQHLIDRGTRVAAIPVAGGWLEVDTVEDLDRYEALRAGGDLADLFAAVGS